MAFERINGRFYASGHTDPNSPHNAEGHERQCVASVYLDRDPDTAKPVAQEDGSFRKRRCQRFAIRGGTVCVSHGGNTRKHKAAARRRRALMAAYGYDLAMAKALEKLEAADDNWLILAALDRFAARFDKLNTEADDGTSALAEELEDLRDLLTAQADGQAADGQDDKEETNA